MADAQFLSMADDKDSTRSTKMEADRQAFPASKSVTSIVVIFGWASTCCKRLSVVSESFRHAHLPLYVGAVCQCVLGRKDMRYSRPCNSIQKAAEHGQRCATRSLPVAHHDPLHWNCKSGLRLHSELGPHLNLDGTLGWHCSALHEDVVPEPPAHSVRARERIDEAPKMVSSLSSALPQRQHLRLRCTFRPSQVCSTAYMTLRTRVRESQKNYLTKMAGTPPGRIMPSIQTSTEQSI